MAQSLINKATARAVAYTYYLEVRWLERAISATLNVPTPSFSPFRTRKTAPAVRGVTPATPTMILRLTRYALDLTVARHGRLHTVPLETLRILTVALWLRRNAIRRDAFCRHLAYPRQWSPKERAAIKKQEKALYDVRAALDVLAVALAEKTKVRKTRLDFAHAWRADVNKWTKTLLGG